MATSRPGSLLLSRAPVTSSEKPSGGGPQRPVMSWVPPGSDAATKYATVQGGSTAIPSHARMAFSAGTATANPGMSNSNGAAPVRYASPHANLSSVTSAPAVGKGGFRWQPTGEQGPALTTPRTSQPSAVVVNTVADETGLRATGAPKGVVQSSCVRSTTDEKKLMRELPDRTNNVTGSGSVTVSAPASSVALTPAAPQQASGTFPVGTAAAGSRSVAVPIVTQPNGAALAPSATAAPVRVVAGGASGRAPSQTPREGGRRRPSSPPPPQRSQNAETFVASPAVPLSASPNAALPVGMSQVQLSSNRARCMVLESQQPLDGVTNAEGSAQRWVSPVRGIESVPSAPPAAVTPAPPMFSAAQSPRTEPPSWIRPPGGWFHSPAAVVTNQSPRHRSVSPSGERFSGAVRGTTGGRAPTRKADTGAAARSGSLSAPVSNAAVVIGAEAGLMASEAGANSMAWSGSPRAPSPTPRFTSNGAAVSPQGSALVYSEAATMGSCEAPVSLQGLPRASSPPASFTVPNGRHLPASFSASAAGAPQAPASFAALATAVATGSSEKAARPFSNTALSPVKRCNSGQAWTDVAPPGGTVAAPPGTTLTAVHTAAPAGNLPASAALPVCPPPGGTVSAPPGDHLQMHMPSFASRMPRSVSSQTAQDLALRSAAVPFGTHRMPSSRGTSRASTPPGQQRASMFTSVPTQMNICNLEPSNSPNAFSHRRQTEHQSHTESSVPEEAYGADYSSSSDAVPEVTRADANGASFDGTFSNGVGDVLLDEAYYNGVCSVPDLQPRHMAFDGIPGGSGRHQNPNNARSVRSGVGSMQAPMLPQVCPPQVSGSGATSSRHTLPAGGGAGVRGSSMSREDSRGGTPLKQRSAASLARPLGVSGVSPRSRDRRNTGSPQERSESAPRVIAPVDRASTNDQPSRRTGGVSPRSSPLKAQQEPTLQLRLSMAMMAEEHGMAPGAADKWKVLQLFHESLPRSLARVERIDRLTAPHMYRSFLDVVGEEECEVGFYAPAGPSQLARLRDSGFCIDDFEEVPGLGFGVPVSSHAGAAHQRACGPRSLLEGEASGGERCICVMLCAPMLFARSASTAACASTRNGTDQPSNWREYCVLDPNLLLISYTVWYQQVPEDRAAPGPRDGAVTPPMAEPDRRLVLTERRRKQLRQQREYAKVRDPLIKVALQGLERVADGTMSTVLLPTTSVEAESVVSLYLLGGGGSRVNRPPGVDPREALGGVVVQRIENQPLFREYTGLGQASDGAMSDSQSPIGENGGSQPRYREDVVWHGTRLKKADGEGASLATKLQSIAEKGFDPQRCMKGAAAEGGIWVATTPLASFGHGCDGLVAFVLCLSKTHFNEWVDATCARVLQRERVLPLYSLVHA